MNKRDLNKVTVIMAVAAYLLVTAKPVCYAEDPRIAAELKDTAPLINPLKQALGATEYNRAMASGEYSYSGNLKCRLCHRDFFMGRKKDAHEHSFKASIGPEYADEARCLVCHTTGYGVDSGFTTIRETPKLASVQCEGCHGPGSKHNKIGKKGGFLAGTDRPQLILKMCKGCHNERWNRSTKNIEEAYENYKRAEASAAAGN